MNRKKWLHRDCLYSWSSKLWRWENRRRNVMYRQGRRRPLEIAWWPPEQYHRRPPAVMPAAPALPADRPCPVPAVSMTTTSSLKHRLIITAPPTPAIFGDRRRRRHPLRTQLCHRQCIYHNTNIFNFYLGFLLAPTTFSCSLSPSWIVKNYIIS